MTDNLTYKQKIEEMKSSILNCYHCEHYTINHYPTRCSCEPRNPLINKFSYFSHKIVCRDFKPSLQRCPGIVKIWTCYNDYARYIPILENLLFIIGSDDEYQYRISALNWITGNHVWDKVIKCKYKYKFNKNGHRHSYELENTLDPLYKEYIYDIRRMNQPLYEDIEYHGNVKKYMIAFAMDYINGMKRIFPQIKSEQYSNMYGIMDWYYKIKKELNIIKEYPKKYKYGYESEEQKK